MCSPRSQQATTKKLLTMIIMISSVSVGPLIQPSSDFGKHYLSEPPADIAIAAVELLSLR